jgi:hypothetical protein
MSAPFELNPDPLAQLQEGIALLFNAQVIGIVVNTDDNYGCTRLSLGLLLPRAGVTIDEFRSNWARLAQAREKETIAQPGIAGRRIMPLHTDREVFCERNS